MWLNTLHFIDSKGGWKLRVSTCTTLLQDEDKKMKQITQTYNSGIRVPGSYSFFQLGRKIKRVKNHNSTKYMTPRDGSSLQIRPCHWKLGHTQILIVILIDKIIVSPVWKSDRVPSNAGHPWICPWPLVSSINDLQLVIFLKTCKKNSVWQRQVYSLNTQFNSVLYS